MSYICRFFFIIFATLAGGLVVPTSAEARDGEWRADFVTRKGHTNCIESFSVSFRIDDGIIKGNLEQEGISWVYRGSETGNKLKIIAISTGGEHEFSLEGETQGDSGSGVWKNSLGCEGIVDYARIGN